MNLLNLAITSAFGPTAEGTATVNAAPRNVTAQATFSYGSGGTSVDVWLQTSLDGGLTWADIANFHFTTASARVAINLNAQTPQTAPIVLTDGAMAANTAQDGLLGCMFRCKLASAGIYAATTVRVDLQGDQFQR